MQLDMGGVDAHSDLIRSLAVVNSDGRNLHPVEGQIPNFDRVSQSPDLNTLVIVNGKV